MISSAIVPAASLALRPWIGSQAAPLDSCSQHWLLSGAVGRLMEPRHGCIGCIVMCMVLGSVHGFLDLFALHAVMQCVVRRESRNKHTDNGHNFQVGY